LAYSFYGLKGRGGGPGCEIRRVSTVLADDLLLSPATRPCAGDEEIMHEALGKCIAPASAIDTQREGLVSSADESE